MALAGTRSLGQAALALAIALFLGLFLVVPVVTVIYVAFTEKGGGALTLVNFLDFTRTELFQKPLLAFLAGDGCDVVT